MHSLPDVNDFFHFWPLAFVGHSSLIAVFAPETVAEAAAQEEEYVADDGKGSAGIVPVLTKA